MAKPGRSWFGQLWLQLTVVFICVALAVIVAGLLIFSLTIGSDFNRLERAENGILTQTVARSAGAAYDHVGWRGANLDSVLALVGRGWGVEIRTRTGRLVRASPGFTADAAQGATVTERIMARGKWVGLATVAFGRGRVARLVSEYLDERWRDRIASAIIAILLAVVAAFPLSRLLRAPVDRLIWAARARASGSTDARVGQVKGFGKLQELAGAFDEMADATQEQDQLRRNLVADVAHELRTPIAVLQAGHEAILDGLTEPTSEQIVWLHDEVTRLARMVDDLQRLASAEVAALQLTLVRRDLAVVAATAAASLVDSFEASSVTLVERLIKAEVLCDPLRIHEVVVNLLTNALKFTPAGGQVTLETARCGETGRFAVSDTGVGIPPEELPHVAERFFRGQRSSEVAGSGIGLTIVAELVRAHNGTLDIASKVGEGTTVSVILPLAGPGRADQLPQWPNRPSGPRRRHVSIITSVDEESS